MFFKASVDDIVIFYADADGEDFGKVKEKQANIIKKGRTQKSRHQ